MRPRMGLPLRRSQSMSALPEQPEQEPVHLPTTGSFRSPAAATGGGAKSHNPFDGSSKQFPAGGSALPSSATTGGGARPEGRPYELPPNPFVTAGEPRPSPPASGGSAKPEGPFDWLGGPLQPSAPPGGGTKPGALAAELPLNTLNTFFTLDPPSPSASHGGGKPEKLKVDISVTTGSAGKTQSESSSNAGTPGRPATDPPSAPPATPGGTRPDQPGRVHVETSVDIEPPATAAGGAGGPAVPPNLPTALTEMQQLQETQRQGLRQQAEMQELGIKNQVAMALMKLEMDLNTGLVDLIKKHGEGVKHASA
jgi:hypothetical protein